ncbi:response regulator transcription factor [Aquibacillus salsiterrae]|uniref:Response regulator n=1 Tax=Aquibacillus salsiterrae TaxID=2950439 RepID=A0A9X3WCG7_9BACI|nr:response regulator [Aquibacillus salsiterrae]MDC3415821.1 response regulator [Aquibacillus salsiterrae]
MKAIIVDDEKHVREGILLLADWKKHGITEVLEAVDGEEAIALIEAHRPEIIFTDMSMPNRDGISLLRWLHSAKLDSKAIVISGYDDFDYMRNSILYGSFDYILKPIDPDTLNETLERAVDKWKEQVEHQQSILEKDQVIIDVKEYYWDQLFSGLIDEKANVASVLKKIKKAFGIDIASARVMVSVLPVHPLLVNRFNADRDLLSFALLNVVNEVLEQAGNGVAFRNINKDDELNILLWNAVQPEFVLEKIHQTIYQYLEVRCTIFSGDVKGHFVESYANAKRAQQTYNLLTEPAPKLYRAKEVVNKPLLHLLDHGQEIKWALQSGREEQIDAVLDKLFEQLKENNHLSYEQLRLWESQFGLLLGNWLEEFGIKEQLEEEWMRDYWNADGTFSFLKFKLQAKQDCYRLIDALKSINYQKEKDSIQQIASYLKDNYQQDITLQDIADKFFLSREYISRKFKQVYKVTITDYLTKIRMEKACELLKNPNLKIYYIAFEVGYKNEKYFSKVFKKQYGLTPNEYRMG